MKYLLIWFCALFLSGRAGAQLSMDSLLKVLLHSGKFRDAGKEEYLSDSFTRFQSNDCLDHFDVCLDADGNLREYLGLSVVNRRFDPQGRLISIMGYNAKGGYSFWDFPPITRYSYAGNTTTEDCYDRMNQRQSSQITVVDEKGRTIDSIYCGVSGEVSERIVIDYKDPLQEIWIRRYDRLGRLFPNQQGVAVRFQKFDTIYKDWIIEERFLDAHMIAVDEDHKGLGQAGAVLKYSLIKTHGTQEHPISDFYNTQGERVCVLIDKSKVMLVRTVR